MATAFPIFSLYWSSDAYPYPPLEESTAFYSQVWVAEVVVGEGWGPDINFTVQSETPAQFGSIGGGIGAGIGTALEVWSTEAGHVLDPHDPAGTAWTHDILLGATASGGIVSSEDIPYVGPDGPNVYTVADNIVAYEDVERLAYSWWHGVGTTITFIARAIGGEAGDGVVTFPEASLTYSPLEPPACPVRPEWPYETIVKPGGGPSGVLRF